MKVGDEVVCTKEKWEQMDEVAPKKGRIYTIVAIENDKQDGDFFILKECPSELSWWHKGFRPLDYDFVNKVLRQVSPKELAV